MCERSKGCHGNILNQARTWFLKIVSVWTSVYVCVCLCVSAPKAINNYWHDMA